MTLEQYIEKKTHGYAHDLVVSILEGGEGVDENFADSLFRALVLDESMNVDVAGELYTEAMALIGGC